MIFIVVKHPVRPEYADQWPALVEEFTKATRAEAGNLFFDWYRSAEDSNVWLLVEGFTDEASGGEHVSSDHFKAAMGRLPDWLRDVPEIINVEVPGNEWSRLVEMQLRDEQA
jgi:quinol monooxygenase YgiN